jgi:probable HAF family extracellular repeat protein
MNKLNKKLALVLSAALAAPLAASAQATGAQATSARPVYTVTFLPQEFFGNAMNESGHVVTWGRSGVRIWSEAGIRQVSGLDNGFSDGRSINKRDDVAGTGLVEFNFGTAFANIGGVVHNIGAAAPDFGNSDALDINDNNWVVGTLRFSRGGLDSSPYIYRNGHIQVLPLLGGNAGSATAISNSGYVTGWVGSVNGLNGPLVRRQPFLFHDRKMTGLGGFKGDDNAAGMDVNERGQVVGSSSRLDAPGTRGFLYSHGKLVNVGSLGGSVAIASGINNAGVVVGWSTTVGNGREHGFIYAFGRILDLNRLVANRPGWFIGLARDINDRFQILAEACPADLSEACRTVRLDPPSGARNYPVPPFIERLFGPEPREADEPG